MVLITDDLLRNILIPKLEVEIKRAKKIKAVITLDDVMIDIPAKSSPEHAKIAQYAKTPWAKKLVRTRTSRISVSGIMDATGSNDQLWKKWKEWNMVRKEKAAIGDALTYKEGFIEGVKLPGNNWVPIVKNPLAFTAFYGLTEFSDALNADFPDLAMEKIDKDTYRIWDETNIYDWQRPDGSDRFILVGSKPHGAPVVPIVRYANDTNSEGKSVGEIYPLIPLLLRIMKAAYDSGMINHNNSWHVRYATGLSAISDEPQIDGETDEEYQQRLARMENGLRLELGSSDLLTSTDKDTKFGSLPATPPDSFVAVIESLLKELAAVSDTPSDYLTGNAIQQTAEQAANSNASFNAIMDEYRTVFGESHQTLLRLYSMMTGSKVEFTGISWQDTDTGSIAAKVDAYGKMATMLGVPKRALWAELPNMNPEKLEAWIKLAEEEATKEQNQMMSLANMGSDITPPATNG